MYGPETVYLLGAGASWHYGYPTGEELIKLVRDEAERVGVFLTQCSENIILGECPKIVGVFNSHDAFAMQDAYKATAERFIKFGEKIKRLNPTVIDYFLAENPSVADVGRFLIALVLLQCEWVQSQSLRNTNRNKDDNAEDDWYRFVISKIVRDVKEPEDIFKNRVYFVTFNYDTSLERELIERLSQYEVLNEKVVKEYIADSVIHIYGKISHDGKCPDMKHWRSKRGVYDLESRGGKAKALDGALFAAKGIKTISEEKGDNTHYIRKAQDALTNAKDIYILGFGFDEQNCRLLELDRCLSPFIVGNTKTAMVTNFGDYPIINKRIRKELPFNNVSFELEIAPTSVYEALQKHF